MFSKNYFLKSSRLNKNFNANVNFLKKIIKNFSKAEFKTHFEKGVSKCPKNYVLMMLCFTHMKKKTSICLNKNFKCSGNLIIFFFNSLIQDSF